MNAYDLRITDKQASLLVDALDLYSRVLMGQLEEVASLHKWKHCMGPDFDIERIHKLEDSLRGLKTLLGHPPNGSAGIGSREVHDDARKAYDMQQVIRYISSWAGEGKDPEQDERNWNKMSGVNFDEPRKTSHDKEYELPEMRVIPHRLQMLEHLKEED
jgi:hypothetical protein